MVQVIMLKDPVEQVVVEYDHKIVLVQLQEQQTLAVVVAVVEVELLDQEVLVVQVW